MRRILTVLTAFTLITICLPINQVSADPGIRCAKKGKMGGSCLIEIRAPGSGGQPGRPAQPRNTGGGGSGGGGSEEPSWPIEGCIQYDPLLGSCVRFAPSESPGAGSGGTPEPAAIARIAVERMDLHAPEIGLWPHPLEELPDGYNYVGWNNWMWVKNPTPNTWGPITKTVTQSGYSITATAAVTHLTWEMGNGDTKECDKGVEHPEHNTRNEKSPGCGYIYHQTGNYTITATAHWVIVWTGLGQQGTIEMNLTAQAHTKVVEVSAVNIPNDKPHRPSQSPLPPGPTGTPTKNAPCPTNHNKHGC